MTRLLLLPVQTAARIGVFALVGATNAASARRRRPPRTVFARRYNAIQRAPLADGAVEAMMTAPLNDLMMDYPLTLTQFF